MVTKGYQRLVKNSDVIAKCGQLGGNDLCLENNKCSTGYGGFLCQQCAPAFFKDFDGSCRQCSETTYIHVLGGWAFIFLVVFTIIYFLSHGY